MKQVVVVGSGIAGLVAALEMSRKHRVTLVTKARLSESNTRYAQGGIAAAMFADDSVAEHVEDTLRAGAGLCRRSAVEILCAEGPRRVRDLIALGVAFDRKDGELQRGMEGAHSRARVLHAGGDATGLAIEVALVEALRAAEVTVLEHCFACDVLLREGHVVGLEVLSAEGDKRVLEAEAVVLASGGAGQIYTHTTNPEVATGDGVAMALRAGARAADVEFYQFHPTALAVPGNFLISEAVRGDGALLLDTHGRRFMPLVDPRAELAPRDVVARGIAAQMAAQGGAPVLLDATAMGAEFLAKRFPTIDAACRRNGLDWSREPIPVTPAAHYWMGGIQTDEWGRTSVPGLFAVGEVACTGVHGANRLASNSLLESLVFAWRSAEFLNGERQDDAEPKAEEAAGPQAIGGVQELAPEPDMFADRTQVDRAAVQMLMWKSAGIVRSGDGLRKAAAQLRQWKSDGEGVPERETANLLALAKVVVAAALAREESRGAHFREDFPESREVMRHSLVFAEQTELREAAVAC